MQYNQHTKTMTTKDAINHLSEEFKNDPAYRQGWEANIAMAFYDTARQYRKKAGRKYLTLVDIHRIGNQAANNFIDNLSLTEQ